MAKKALAREVRCYHCERVFEISAKAMTVSCPGCFKPVLVEDIVVRNAQGNTTLQTCGRLVVEKRGRVTAKKIQAGQGVEMLGILQASVESGGEVRIGPTGNWTGDCCAKSLRVEPGGVIVGGFFRIGPDGGKGLAADSVIEAKGAGKKVGASKASVKSAPTAAAKTSTTAAKTSSAGTKTASASKAAAGGKTSAKASTSKSASGAAKPRSSAR